MYVIFKYVKIEAVDESPQTEEQTESKAPSTELVTSAVNRSEERPSIATQAASEDIEVQTVKEIDLDKYETVDKVSVSTVPSMKKERKTRLLRYNFDYVIYIIEFLISTNSNNNSRKKYPFYLSVLK